MKTRLNVCALLLVLRVAGCALPGIHRDAADGGKVAPDAGHAVASAVDEEDAGAPRDARDDPANLNEDYAAFRALVPEHHVFAEWPMPDTSAGAKARPSYTVSQNIIIDNVTKLRWQAKMPSIYPRCTANYDFVGRFLGVGTGCTWEEAKAYCASPELALELGEGAWRVPTKIELESLIDVSRVNAVDPLFDDFPIDSVWTSSPFPNPDGLKMSWRVDFMEGTSAGRGRTKGTRVRCVSSPNAKGGSEQSFEHSETVARDANTQLEWQRFPDDVQRGWRDAIAYCDALDLEGTGWHLPTVKELLTLVDSTRHEPAIDARIFPVLQGETFWTSTEHLDSRTSAYLVEFANGEASLSSTFEELHFARCVR